MTFGLNGFAQSSKTTSNVYLPQFNQAVPSKGFGGFYTQAGLGYQSFSPTFSNSNYTVGGITYSSGAQSSSVQNMTGVISAGYDFPINSTLLLGVGADFSPLSGQSTSFGGVTINGTTIPSSSYTVNNSNNLFVSTMFLVDPMTAVYGKLGYSKVNINSGPNLDSLEYSGYSVGLGYKTILSGNYYAYIEGNYFNYGKLSSSGTAIVPGDTPTAYSYSNSSTANAYNLIYGVGIRF